MSPGEWLLKTVLFVGEEMSREEYIIAEFDTDLSPAEVRRELLDVVAKLRARGIALEGIEPADLRITKRGHGVGIIEGIVIAAIGAVAKKAVDAAWDKIMPSLKLRLKPKVRKKSKQKS
jgi:hypothetical protein